MVHQSDGVLFFGSLGTSSGKWAWMAPWLGGSGGGGGVVRGPGGTGEELVEEMVFGLAVTMEGSEDRRQPRERGGRKGGVRAEKQAHQRAWVGAGRVVVARGH